MGHKSDADRAYDAGYDAGKNGDFFGDFIQGNKDIVPLPGPLHEKSYDAGYKDGQSDRYDDNNSHYQSGRKRTNKRTNDAAKPAQTDTGSGGFVGGGDGGILGNLVAGGFIILLIGYCSDKYTLNDNVVLRGTRTSPSNMPVEPVKSPIPTDTEMFPGEERIKADLVGQKIFAIGEINSESEILKILWVDDDKRFGDPPTQLVRSYRVYIKKDTPATYHSANVDMKYYYIEDKWVFDGSFNALSVKERPENLVPPFPDEDIPELLNHMDNLFTLNDGEYILHYYEIESLLDEEGLKHLEQDYLVVSVNEIGRYRREDTMTIQYILSDDESHWILSDIRASESEYYYDTFF